MLQHSLNPSNSLTKPASTHNRAPAKSSFLNTRLSATGELKKEVDRSQFEQATKQAGNAFVAELTDQIISGYKTCGERKARLSFIEKITSESLRFLARQQGVQIQALKEEASYNKATATLIQAMFDLLEAYAYEFNHRVGWNDLYVTCTKPSYVTEILRYNKFREPLETVTNYRSRLSTRYCSLVLRGQRNCIEFLLLPVDKVIGLSLAETAYEPISRLEAAIVGDVVEWEIDGKPLNRDRLEVLCMELFATLIERTKDEAKSNFAAGIRAAAAQ